MMYSITSRTSFENIRTKWKIESEENAPGVPIVLVATKTDVREDEELISKLKLESDFQELLTKEDGEKLAKQIGAAGFVECSAKTQKGLTTVFETCINIQNSKKSGKSALSTEDKEKGGCCIVM